MDAPVVAAIVAGCASVISAFFAWQQAVRAKRIETRSQENLGKLNAETQITIERIKFVSENLKTILEVVLEESKSVEDQLLRIWQSVQVMKDVLAATISSLKSEDSPVSTKTIKLLIEDYRKSLSELIKLYSEYGGVLPLEVAEVVHFTKNSSYTILDMLHRDTRKPAIVENLIEQLSSHRERLSQCQASIIVVRSTFRKNQLQDRLNTMSFSGLISSSNNIEKKE